MCIRDRASPHSCFGTLNGIQNERQTENGPHHLTRLRDILTTRGRAFVAAGLTLLLGGFLLGFSDITRVGALLTTLPLLAAVATRRTSSTVEVSRRVQPALSLIHI